MTMIVNDERAQRIRVLRSVIGIEVFAAMYPRKVKIKKKAIPFTEEQEKVIKSRHLLLKVFDDRARSAVTNNDLPAMLKVQEELKQYLRKNPIPPAAK